MTLPAPDPSTASSSEAALLAHARALVGVELGELADQLGVALPVGAVRTKGWAGQIIERELGVETSGAPGPDFSELSIELKTVPVDERLIPLESTAVCQIDPIAIAGESWETSYARRKLGRVLFVALESERGRSVGERRVSAVRLWSPAPAEEALLRTDFELFVRQYFRRGRAEAITGHLGRALQVRPKGKNAADRRAAYDERGRPVLIGKCGFYLRPAFVAAILAGAG
jgi:DNA mismatch repair protein MutH